MTAKLFKNGRSQAVRLPKEFRFEGKEVSIRHNPSTGEVVLGPARRQGRTKLQTADSDQESKIGQPSDSPTKISLQELFAIFDQAHFPDDFFERRTSMPRELKLFE